MSYWTAAQTYTGREQLARLLLTRAGFQTYVPQIKLKRERTALLFPSYIFVCVVDRWYPIVWTPGVTRVLMGGEAPARVPDDVLTGIRGREGRDGFVRLPPKHPRRGTPMAIVRGMFQGHVALFDGMSGRDRQRVLLQLLGQTVTVELPAADAVPA